jgi:6-phosphogluconolactonase
MARRRKMRMKFNKSSQLLLVSAASLLIAGLVTACGTLTVDFVYVTSAKAAGTYSYGEVNVFEVNSESGHMRQIPTSPFPSGGRNPVAEAVSADNAYLYVVNKDDNTIVQFTIGTDGKLYAQNTTNTPGIYPLAVAVNASYLYVLDTYQPLAKCSTAAPCAGSIGVFSLGTTGALSSTPVANGSLTYWPLTISDTTHVILPTGINVVTSGTTTYVYVSAYDTTAQTGYVFGFTSNSGVLTALSGSPYSVGTHPSAVTSNSNGSYLYVTDSKEAVVRAYSISSGAWTAIGSFATGNQPSAIVADSTSNYLYVANAQDSTVNAYSIGSGGALTNLGTYTTGLEPRAIGIDPSKNHFLYTANYLGNNVSGFELTTTGTLINSQSSPYTSNALPTAVAAVPHK